MERVKGMKDRWKEIEDKYLPLITKHRRTGLGKLIGFIPNPDTSMYQTPLYVKDIDDGSIKNLYFGVIFDENNEEKYVPYTEKDLRYYFADAFQSPFIWTHYIESLDEWIAMYICIVYDDMEFSLLARHKELDTALTKLLHTYMSLYGIDSDNYK